MKWKVFYTFFLCLITVSPILSQNQSKADSLKGLIESGVLDGQEELSVYYWLSTYSNSPEEVLKYGYELLKLSKKSDNLKYTLRAYTNIGIGHRLMGDLDEALEYQFMAAEGAFGDEKHLKLLAEIYGEISTCYTLNGDSENALLYGSKTIGILRKTGGGQRLALTLLNTGYDYYLIGKYDSAMAYYNESEPILEDIGMDLGLAYIMGNRALVYWKRNNTDKAKKDLFNAISMLEPLGDTYGMADYYNQLGSIFLEEGNDEKAIEYTTNGLVLAKAEGLKEQVRDASFLLYRLHERKGNYKSSLKFQSDYYAYSDSIENLATTKKLANLRTEYEVGRKQTEVDSLLEKQKKDQLIMIIGAILLIVFIALLIIVYSYLKTKNKLNKQLKEQKESLQMLNQTKDKFFSIISHDLRGPVNTLSGLVTVSRMYMAKGSKEQSLDMIDKMDHSIGSIIKLLNNLLTWALNQRGHFPYMPEGVSIKFLLEDMHSLFEEMSTAKNIELKYDLDEEFQLLVDRNTTSTILRNLVTNAIKFTSDEGQIQINAKANRAEKTGIIEVIDNGVGMSEEKLQHLFKLNEKLSTKGTSGETGLGLGLQLVYDFVKLNKGEVEVASELNKGTKFTVSLPLHID